MPRKGLARLAGVGIAGAALSLVMAAPAFAENVHAGEFCAKKRVGQFTTGSNGALLQCTFASGGPTPRWHGAAQPGGGGAVPAQPHARIPGGGGTGSSGTGAPAHVIPQTVSAGSGGTADASSSPLPLAVGGAGIAVLAGSAAVLARRKS